MIDDSFFRQEWLTTQIIAYIGNKRRLLPLIYRAVTQFFPGDPQGLRFLDLFAGSGVVSRLGKALGWEVHANDWEDYSFILNRAYLLTDPREVDSLFPRGLKSTLEELNALTHPREEYMARYFAPESRDIDSADWRKERLYYTRENALIIDAIREKIDELFPGEDSLPRDLLLALLLYQAATHTNTSGVFKAYHKGFGGHGKDALTRILRKISLPFPALCESPAPCFVYRKDANLLLDEECSGTFDIVYLDPPYNQHQYGSNYHMLNTIARWDRIPLSGELDSRGILKDKGGIRKDWHDTKSLYCYRQSALSAFEDLIGKINARLILVSYSTDGIIPFEEMRRVCARKGRLHLITNAYTKYPGGKQSNSRMINNIEFIIAILPGEENRACDRETIDQVLLQKKLTLLCKKTFSREKLKTLGELKKKEASIYLPGGIVLETEHFFRLSLPSWSGTLKTGALKDLTDNLERCLLEDRAREMEEILSRLGEEDEGWFIKQIPGTLRKLAHKKHRELFTHYLKRVKNLERSAPTLYALIAVKIQELEKIAGMRFGN